MTTNRDAATVLAKGLADSHGNIHGPMALLHAENQVAALERAGYAIVPRRDVWAFAGWLRRNLPTLEALERKRGIRLLDKINAILPPSESDDA